MSYVSPASPLPRNSQDAISQCEADRAATIVNTVEKLVAHGQAASAQIAGPSSFRQFGPGVVIDVARSQNAAAAASAIGSPAEPTDKVVAGSPQMIPLNVSEKQFAGCSVRGTDALLPMIAKPQVLTMPPRMPASVTIPAQASPPKYSNLCWALRNAAVDVSQFDPAELEALQYGCMQKGYAGACVPPPLVALWLDQQRRAGTLPHISVSAADIAAIPQAPPLTGVDCSQSWTLAGMAGYMPSSQFPQFRMRQGMGAAWGSTSYSPCADNATVGSSLGANFGAVSWKAWTVLALVGVGLYAAGRK